MNLNRFFFAKLFALAIGAMLFVALGACGGGSTTGNSSSNDLPTIKQIDMESLELSIEDFDELRGLKVTSDFDVSELPGAIGVNKASLTVARGDPPRIYEFRFYPSHQDAVNMGVSYVQDVVGENRVLLEAEQRWVEGHKLRITCQGQGGHHIGTCVSTYPYYIIRGNTIVLCGGQTVFDAQENCSFLMDRLLGTPASG